MDFEYSKEQEMIVSSAREIAEDFGPEYWFQKEENHEFPSEFIETIGKVGFIGLGIPEEYGGSGLGLTEGAIAFQELCANGGGLAPMLMHLYSTVFGGLSILKHGREEQKKRYLPKIATGEIQVCLGLTEPDAGTNTFNIRTFAQKKGDAYVINGNKVFISGFENAGAIVLVTRTTEKDKSSKKGLGLSLFLIDLPNQAIESNPIPKHGTNYVPSYELYISDLEVPQECLLGEEGMGWYHILDTLNPERIMGAAGAVGLGKVAISTAVRYAKKRTVFDNVIGSYQGIQFPLASAYAKLECAWLATLKAAVLYDKQAPQKKVGDISNIAKYFAAEACSEAVQNSMQTLGGYGYAKEYHIERWCREMFLIKLAPISQEMALNYTAEHILGLPRSY
jgi:acyl-CoA dehydrogenase